MKRVTIIVSGVFFIGIPKTYNSRFLANKRDDPDEGIWKVLPFKGVRSGEVGEEIGKAEKEAAAVFSILQYVACIRRFIQF